jgi:hypothetical protein
MTAASVEVPNPITRGADAAFGWSFDKFAEGLVGWVLDGVAWAARAVVGFVDTSTSPRLHAAWFIGDGMRQGPYRVMLSLAAALLMFFVFAGLIQGVLGGDVAGMVRRLAFELPLSVGGMVSAVAVTQLLIDVVDAISSAILSNFGSDIGNFVDGLANMSAQSGGVGSALVVFLLGLFTLLAGLVLFAELVIRSALIYLVVGLCPLAFAALLWPATRGVLRKTVELLCALIGSKVAISLALAIGAAALGGAGTAPRTSAEPAARSSASAATAPDPETPNVTAAAGVLLAGLATFTVACFSPFVILRLFPIVEGAVVAQGLRGAPLRGAQSAMYMKSQVDASRRFGSGAHQSSSHQSTSSAASGKAAFAGSAKGSAAAPAVAAATAATAAVRSAVRTTKTAVQRQTEAAAPPSGTTTPTKPRRPDSRD